MLSILRRLTELNVSLRLHSEFSLSVVALAIALQVGWTHFQNDASCLPSPSPCGYFSRLQLCPHVAVCTDGLLQLMHSKDLHFMQLTTSLVHLRCSISSLARVVVSKPVASCSHFSPSQSSVVPVISVW